MPLRVNLFFFLLDKALLFFPSRCSASDSFEGRSKKISSLPARAQGPSAHTMSHSGSFFFFSFFFTLIKRNSIHVSFLRRFGETKLDGKLASWALCGNLSRVRRLTDGAPAPVSGCAADRHPSPRAGKRRGWLYCGSTWEGCLKEACSAGEEGWGRAEG